MKRLFCRVAPVTILLAVCIMSGIILSIARTQDVFALSESVQNSAQSMLLLENSTNRVLYDRNA